MEKIKIITDSTCDLPNELIAKHDIEVIPLEVTIDNVTYLDGVDITLEEFLDKMDKADESPKTSQITPGRFSQVYKKYLDEGYSIVSLHLSSKMSGTFQSATIAKGMLETDKIFIVDSQNVTCGLGMLVLKACALKNENYNAEEIYKIVLQTIPKVKSTLNFESLDNLVKGGRLSKTQGIIGGLLGIKLNLAVENGEMVVRDKVRGSKKALRYIIEYLEQTGISTQISPIVLNAAADKENAEVLQGIKGYLQNKGIEYVEAEVGCVVGTHSGRNACGIFFIEC
ncbi:Protein DegV [bioreactor metagenome]|uniref:Protein DegV n=1 Tax=bioreactor metagenome TaxID=1076179 RepID=A0A644ZB09_9ZZZZ